MMLSHPRHPPVMSPLRKKQLWRLKLFFLLLFERYQSPSSSSLMVVSIISRRGRRSQVRLIIHPSSSSSSSVLLPSVVAAASRARDASKTLESNRWFVKNHKTQWRHNGIKAHQFSLRTTHTEPHGEIERTRKIKKDIAYKIHFLRRPSSTLLSSITKTVLALQDSCIGLGIQYRLSCEGGGLMAHLTFIHKPVREKMCLVIVCAAHF